MTSIIHLLGVRVEIYMVCTVGIRGVDYSNDKASVEGLLEVAANKSLL